MAPKKQAVQSILTGIISSIIVFIQLNVAILSYQADYQRKRASLIRLLAIPVGRNAALKRVNKKRQFIRLDLDLLDFSVEFDMFTFKINQKLKQNLLTRVKIARSKRHRGLVISDSACSLSSSNEFESDSYRFRGYVWTVENATNPDTCGCVNF